MLDFSVRLSEQFDSSLTWSETPKLEPRRQISRQGPVNQNQDDLFILGRMCETRGGGTGGQDTPPPLKKHKNVGFLHNTGLDPQHRRPASKTPFQWRFAGGPMMAHLYW